jgi:hypothetical protein
MKKTTPTIKELSNCCHSPVETVCDEDLGRVGTCHYECLKCGKACDVVVENPTIKELAEEYCKILEDKFGYGAACNYQIEIKKFARWADKRN